jgi:hypothetical protein
MLIDCDACTARGPACGDCVVTVLLSGPPAHGHAPPAATDPADGAAPRVPLELDGAERTALANLARSGLVPPLRLVPVEPPRRRGADPGDGDVSCVS